MNKKKKKLGILAKIENNYFSTTNYVKPITPTVNLSLNSRDFSVKSTVEIVGLAFGGYAGIQYVLHKEYSRSLKAAILLGIVSGALEIKDYIVKPKLQKKNVTHVTKEEVENGEDENILPEDKTINEMRNNRSFENYDDGQLIGKFIYNGDKVIIFSETGVGKTVFTLGIALDIAHGRVSKVAPNDDGVHSPQTVLYYDGENDSDDYDKIFGTYPIDTDYIHILEGFYFENPKAWLKDVRDRLKETEGNVTVVLDNISCLTSSYSGDQIRKLFIKELNKIQKEFSPRKITFIVVAHTNKDKELMGSNNQNNFATTILKLSENGKDHLRLTVMKDRKYGEMKGKSFLLAKRETEDGFKYDEYVEDSVPSDERKKTSKADNIPPEIIREIKKFYQKGVPGHGYQAVIKKYHLDTEYGINDSKEVSRIIESPD